MHKKIIFPFVFISILLGGFIFRAQIKALFIYDSRSINKIQKTLLIKEELTIESLAKILASEGIVEDSKNILEFAENNGLLNADFSPGKYLILPQTQMSSLVRGFQVDSTGHGKSEQKVNVLFNYCRNIHEMAGNVSKCILADSAEIVEYISSEEFLNKNEVTMEELSSLFIPATYKMYFDLDAKEFTDEMMLIRNEFWSQKKNELLDSLGLSKVQVSTLASIVYSEQAKMSEEWSTIAGLYLNRLKRGILLQSDPTFKFCWGSKLDGAERLTFEHRDIDCPYNTYKYAGLPPGPICLVPSIVLDAVLEPELHSYIFMVAKPGGGGHNFSETYTQHKLYVNKYRKWERDYLKGKRKNEL